MKKLIILFILLLILPVVNAQFNQEQAANFVSEQSSADTITKAYQVLSLSFYDPTTADKIATQIKSAGTNCWPTSCQIKDTSLALMALHKRGESIDTSWLFLQQTASTSGKWYLQIDTSAVGTCKISYDDKETIVNIDKGELSTSNCKTKSTKLDINSCIKPNLLSKPSKKIIVDCDELGSTPTISLLNQEGTSYYILGKAVKTAKLTLYINNGYFGIIEDTLFANWFLEDINSKVDSIIWLKKNFEKNNVIHNSLMYLATSDEAYLSYLIDLQEQTGSFGDTYDTAIATLALARSGKYNSALESARDFLGNKQLSDGSVENNLLYTSITLYSYSITKPAEKVEEFPTEEPLEGITEEICNYDGICDIEYGENYYNCPSDCEEELEQEEEEVYEEEEEAPSKAWIWILIILIILAVLGYLYYTKFYKKGKKLFVFKKKKPKPKLTYKPLLERAPTKRVRLPIYTPRRITRKSKVERELEKSLEEARKLLKKK